jgi:putative multiple sugar transport system permease protein
MFSRNLRQGGILVAFVLIVAVFAVWTDGKLLDPGNISNLVLQYSYILILAIGMLFVIVVGHIDLSVGSVVALVGAVAATLVIKNGMPWWVGVLAGIATGLAIGAWHGLWVAYVGIPGFIVTLSGMLLFRGMTFRVLNSVSLSPMPPEFQRIASGFLNGLFGGYGFDVFTVVIGAFAAVGYAYSQWRSRSAKIRYEQAVESMGLFIAKIVLVAAVIMYFAWKLSTARGFPIVLIILAFLILAYSFVSKNTIYGRHVYAIGGNLNAALLSGVKVKRTIFWVYVHMGLLAGIAGVVFSSRSNGAQPSAGNMFELDAIAACFIGGAAVTGGVGTVAGAMIGGLVMAVMSNGMQLQGVQVPTQQIVKGLVLLLAVAFDVWNKRRAAAAKS